MNKGAAKPTVRQDSARDGWTLVHFGDLHLWHIGWDRDFYWKRLLGLANLMLRRGRQFPRTMALELVEQLSHETTAEAVLFSGDLSTTGLREEFKAGRHLFHPLLKRHGNRFVAIPGNHDRYTPRVMQCKLFEHHFLGCAEQVYPFAIDLTDPWTVVAFDCSVPRRITSRGHMGERAMAQLHHCLERHGRRGRKLIALGHYPLVFPAGVPERWNHAIPERGLLYDLLHENGVSIYLHGHRHERCWVYEAALHHCNCGWAGQLDTHPSQSAGYLRIHLKAEGPESAEAVYWQGLHRSGQWVRTPMEPRRLA